MIAPALGAKYQGLEPTKMPINKTRTEASTPVRTCWLPQWDNFKLLKGGLNSMSRNNDKANTGTIENRLSFICPTIQLTISQMGTESES